VTQAPATPPAPTRAASAFLNLNSLPISSVVLDGRPLGPTPLVGVSVTPGDHTVAFVHPELGRRSASIRVGQGERKAVVVRFRRAE
jgi:serine/threonine-protein kinase